jgi:hypothetical protein
LPFRAMCGRKERVGEKVLERVRWSVSGPPAR